jgi:ABC-type glycerol-3-phosphate transport system permease component
LFLTFLFLLLPIVWLVFSSFRSNDSIQAGQLWPAPGDYTLANYAEVFHINGLVGFLVNSIVIATATTLLVVFLGSLAAYGLSRFALRGKELFMTAALLPQFFPYVLVLIPFYVLMSNLGLVDTHFGLILTHTSITLPFGLWMLTGYFNAIPRELDQAASIDGCSRLGVLFRIIYPIAVPGLVVAGFFAFVVSWGDYLFVSILSQSQGTQTLPIALQTFMSSLTEEPPLARTHTNTVPTLLRRWKPTVPSASTETSRTHGLSTTCLGAVVWRCRAWWTATASNRLTSGHCRPNWPP